MLRVRISALQFERYESFFNWRFVESEMFGEGSGALLCNDWYYHANVQFCQLYENQGTEEALLCEYLPAL